MGTLYIVATPIGNLEDMTFRAIRILREVQLIAAEDTRTSRVLTNHYEIDTPMTSYHEHNKLTKLDHVFQQLKSGDVALISDAGTPGISDPGYELIHEAIQRGHTIVPVPGASAVTSALVASGLPTDSFTYIGFLPKKQSARRDLFKSFLNDPRTLIAYESPHRIADTLGQVASVMGDKRRICVAREMTKKFEEFWRGTAKDGAVYFSSHNPKGEVTLLIAGAEKPANWDKETVRAALTSKIEEGLSLSRAAKEVAALSGWKKSVVYELGLEE
ncbi:MAG: 16S rRNA (cytidine(1402)-2'-O)-methyltransferase [Chloroflexota bacterium]